MENTSKDAPFNTDRIDMSKWWYAIEMEVLKDTTTEAKINNIAKELEKTKYKWETTIISNNTESAEIKEYKIRTANIKYKSDLYKKVGELTKNNTHSPIGEDKYLSGWTHLHLFLTEKWRERAKNNYWWIFKQTITKIGHCKIRKRSRDWIYIYHRARNRTMSFMMDNLDTQTPQYGRIKSMGLSKEFRSIEFRCNNVIHPFQFLYFMALLKGNLQPITSIWLYSEETFKIIEMITDGCTKQFEKRGLVPITELGVLTKKRLEVFFREVYNFIPKEYREDNYRIEIMQDYLDKVTTKPGTATADYKNTKTFLDNIHKKNANRNKESGGWAGIGTTQSQPSCHGQIPLSADS